MSDTPELHPLVVRQWHKHVGREPIPAALRPFLTVVSDAYRDSDDARRLTERALDLSSTELHAANGELRGILAALPDHLFRICADDRITAPLQGPLAPEHPAWPCGGDRAPGPSAERFWSAVREVRDRRVPVTFDCSPGADPDLVAYEVRLMPFVDRDIIGVIRDVTERRRAEIALRESEERLALAQYAGHIGTFDWSIADDRVFWTAEAERIFGLEPGEFAGTHAALLALVSAEDRPRLAARIENWLASERPEAEWEFRLAAADRWIESKAYAFRDSAGQPTRVIGTYLDITARKLGEQDRLVLAKLESTSLLAGGIAHDFNNLLTSVLLNIGMAGLRHPDDQTLGVYLHEATQAITAAKALTDQFMTFARGGPSTRRATALAPLLRESLNLSLLGSNLEKEILIADDLWPVEVDSGQFSQVVRNLAVNAREAMPGGGFVTLHARNLRLPPGHASGLPAGRYVHIRFTDQGPGIAPGLLANIFDPYFSTKQRGTQKGMGLGLTVAHSIMQEHAGAILVESPPGVGATFHLYLPACSEPLLPAPPPVSHSASPFSRGRVLVMDDEQMIRTIFKVTLKRLGYEAELVADGQSAIALYTQARAAQRPFDVVIADLTVRGGMGGPETLQGLLALDPSARVLLMSGYTDDEAMRDHARLGFKGTLIKPFDHQTLGEILQRVIGR